MKLVIEIDGSYPLEEKQRIKDQRRQAIIVQMGLNFRRFSEQQERKELDLVLKAIEKYISELEMRIQSRQEKLIIEMV